MRIYQMTATFGNLEHQTLTLEPGLNVITAPNEWGKSTWCAFLVAMLYGMDTGSKTDKNALTDKEHYAPWSGKPMKGRIDLNWNSRDITIVRKTKNHIPLGDFTAYETNSGIPVPELTAANCGQLLLGVEQSVFQRSGFIRQTELPVTYDEALSRRLNAFVTTGDENDAADRMADTLQELRNKCRYNRSGLIPQAESQRDALLDKQAEMDTLDTQCQKLKDRIDGLQTMVSQLHNHQQALDYAAAQAQAQRITQAQATLETKQAQLQSLEETCAQLPTREEAEKTISQLRRIRTAWDNLQAELEALPDAPRKPLAPPPFALLLLEDARKMLREDTVAYVSAKHNITAVLLLTVGVLGLISTGALVYLRIYLFAGIAGVGSLTALLWGLVELIRTHLKKSALQKKYGNADQTRWSLPLANYERQLKAYNQQMQTFQKSNNAMQTRFNTLKTALEKICGAKSPEATVDACTRAIATWDSCAAAAREVAQAQSYLDTIRAMAKPVPKPAHPDSLTQTKEETNRLLSECAAEQQRLRSRLSQYQEHRAALGSRDDLQRQLSQQKKRIDQLETEYSALVIAQDTLMKAKAELQKRFAPKILQRAQLLMSLMTGGKYQTISMDPQFSFQTSAEQEETLRDISWRSDGTIDQLYLSLRLAVAEALTPDAPLILDDALVRFDDQRMKAALSILQEIGRQKQIILFTSQNREGMV